MKKLFFIIIFIFGISLIWADNENPADKDTIRFSYWYELGANMSNSKYLKDYISAMDSLDIKVIPPADFKMASVLEEGESLLFSPNPKFESQFYWGVIGWSIMGPIFESDLKDALIVYPLAIEFIGISPDSQIEKELMAANNSDSIDITQSVSILSNPNESNSDKILLYEYDIEDPRWKDYKHCVALAFRKKNHYTFPIKIFLNEDGLKKKEKHIERALKSVSYGDKPKPEWIELENMVRSDEGIFPMKKVPKCKH